MTQNANAPTSIQQLTVQGVAALIDKVATSALAKGESTSPAMLTAMESVLTLLDGKASQHPELKATLAKVRKATGLNKQKETNA